MKQPIPIREPSSLLFLAVMPRGPDPRSQVVQEVILAVNLPEFAGVFEGVRKGGAGSQSSNDGFDLCRARGRARRDGLINHSPAQDASIAGRVFTVPLTRRAGKRHLGNL